MEKKLTKAQMLETIIATAKDVLSNEQAEFLRGLINAIIKKNANRKPTKTQLENEDYKTAILDAMEVGKRYTVSDLMKCVPALEGMSNQRASAIVRQLKDSGAVTRTEEKGKAYFTLAE